jgi:lipopolysaccharide export system permease protein
MRLRRLSKYLLMDFLAVFGTAMLLITFAFSIGAIYKAIDVMAKGLPVSVVGKFFLYNLPYSMAYTIPISALVAALLLFGRLSSDSEISAMKSGGLSLWQIASPILLASMGLVCVCLYINCILYPKTTYANKKLLKSMGVEDPIKLLEEGRFIRDFPGYMIYVGKKNRNRVRDLVVYEVDKHTDKITGTVRADSGIMSSDNEKSLLKIDLFDVRIEIPDPKDPDDSSKTRYVNAKKYPIRIDFNELMNRGTVDKSRKNMSIFELFHKIRNFRQEYHWMSPRDQDIERGRCLIDAHQRICLALGALTFVMMAIPLGIKSHRKESSIGMLMSLGIVFVYYLFMIISDTLDAHPEYYPWLIPWIPILSWQIGGILLMRRAN